MDRHWGKLIGYFVVVAALTTGMMYLPVIFGGSWMPASIAREAGSIDGLFIGLVVLSIIIFSLVMAIVFYSVVHFRADRGDDSDGEPIHGHLQLEVVWTIIPLVIVLVIAGLSYKVMVDNEANAARGSERMTVFVRAFSFGWKFSQSEAGQWFSKDELRRLENDGRSPAKGLVEASELVLPVNTTVRFFIMSCSRLESVVPTKQPEGEEVRASGACVRRFGPPSKDQEAAIRQVKGLKYFIPGQEADVNHAFWVPEARMKIDAVSGLSTWTQWTPTTLTKVGDHPQVVCAELCGSGHNGMRTDVCIVDRGTWEWWSSELTATASVPCAQLKYLTCLPASDVDTVDERAAAIEKIAKLLSDNKEHKCADLEGAA